MQNDLNTDYSVTVTDMTSFSSPKKILPIAQESKYFFKKIFLS